MRPSGVRTAVSALAGVVSFALLGVFINPLPAQAEAAPPAAEAQVTSRPDSLSASLTARSTGHRVEDLSQRTESTQVFANPDSTWTLESYTAPKFSQKSDGSWSDARTDLVFGTDSVVGSVAGAQLALSDGETPADGVADLVKISAKDSAGKAADLTLGWEGALPKPALDKAEAEYPEAAEHKTSPEMPGGAGPKGADVRVEATRTGFSHSVILPERPAEAPVFRFPLKLSKGLTAAIVSATGAIEVKDAAGKLVFFASRPMMWDSRTDEHSGLPVKEAPVPTALETIEGVQTLVLSPPQAFFDDTSVQYPVTVDPSWSTMVSGDTWVQSDTTSPQDTSGELRAGSWDAGVHKARAYMVFPTSALNGKKILDAKIQINNWWSYSCTASNIYAQRITQGWNTTTLLWNNQPTVTSTGQQAVSTARGFSSACPAGNTYFPVTPIVQTWADTPSTNLGIRLVAGTETDSNSWRRYTSANSSSADAATEPHLQVTYNSYPNTPSSGTNDPAQTVLWVDPVTGVQTRYVNTRKPTLSAIVSDSDGGTVKGLWTLTTGATKTWNQLAGTTVASGGRSTFVPGTSTPSLTEGAVYAVDVWANDGSLTSKAAFRHTVFTIDSTPPPAPTITANNLSNGQWADPKPGSNTFTFTGSSADTVKFQYSQDGAAYVTDNATGSPATGTLAWVADGSHTLAVRSVDKAGNISGTTTFTYGAGSAAMTSPLDEAKSTDQFTVKASSPTATAGTVTPTVYWRPAGGSEPGDFSATNGSATDWTAATTLPAIAAGSAVNVDYRWSAQAAAESLGKARVPVLLDVQVCFAYSSPAMTRCTHTAAPGTDNSVLKLPHAFGQGFPTADAGPGQVALWTGEFNTSDTDASLTAGGTGLEVSRSYSSLAGVDDGSVFGPGWAGSFDAADSGAAGVEVIDNTLFDGTLALVSGDGVALIYRQPGNGRVQDETGVYAALGEDATAGNRVEITGTGTAARLNITDADGAVTVFSPIAYTAGTATEWAPLSVTEPGSVGATSFSRDAQGRIIRILAPVPDGVSCAAAGSPLVAGCRALHIDYATATTATSSVPGDISGQVKAIWFDAYNPAKAGGAGMDSVMVADYAYNSSKQLVRATDSRAGRSTSYEYSGTSGSGAPLLTRVIPAGKAGYTLAYGQASQDNSSLLTVSRDNPSGSGAAVQLSRFVYGIDPTQANGNLPALTGNDVALWDQVSAPTYGAAVFAADKALGTSDPAQVAAGDWKYGQLSFTDAQGYTVNTAEYGAGAWQIAATDYQANNVVRQFTPAAIAAMKQAASDQSLPAGSTLGTNNQLASITRYNKEIKAAADITLTNGEVIHSGTVLTPAGSFVTDTWAPVGPAGLNGTPARAHVHTDFDQGAPGQGINLATGQPYNLPTTVTTTQAAPDTESPDTNDPLATGEATISQLTNGYDPIDGASATGPTSGWTLGAATTTTTVMENTAQNQTVKTRFDARGRVLELRKPGSNRTDAGTTLTDYYTAGTGAAGCSTKPEWAGLPCLVHTAEATASKPAVKTTGYTMFLDTTQTVETMGASTRTTDTSYLASGEEDTVTTTASGLTGSTAIAGTKTLYDAATGETTATLSLNSGGTETGRTSTAYDGWGRVTSYTDGAGAVTTTGYTNTSEPATVTTPHGTTTYSYDGTDGAGKEERRGKATGMTITGAGTGGSTGTFTAGYDAAGSLTAQTMPGGITQTRDYDTTGKLTGLSYNGAVTVNGVPGTGPWITWSRSYDVAGRVVGETTPDGIALLDNASSFARTYAYDRASRLVTVQDRTTAPGAVINTDPAEGAVTPCVTRSYAFDLNGNRTGQYSATSGSDGACPATASSGKAWSYDAADRVLTGANTAGSYTYDAFGRQTLIPAADTPRGTAAGNLTLSYYDNDAAHTITQAGVTTSYTLDPEGRRASAVTGTATDTNGYSDDSDSSGWVTETNGGTPATTRYESSLGGDLGVTITGTDIKLSIINPHQDVVSTVTLPASGDAQGLDSWTNYDEYGNQAGTTPATGPANYGWVGAKQRATDTTGLLLMGARLYNPTTGLFTSVDPVAGGNSTDYTYPQDPINRYDLSGKWDWDLTWNIVSIATMFIPGGLLVGAAVRTVVWGVRAVQAYRATQVARVLNYVNTGYKTVKQGSFFAPRWATKAAGKQWAGAGATRYPYGNGGYRLYNPKTTYQYRSPQPKVYTGRLPSGTYSNFNHSVRGKSFNVHVRHRSFW